MKTDINDALRDGGVEAVAERAKAERYEPPRLFTTSTQFVRSFTPPDYLIDGLIQRRFIYSMTGPTGSGKTCLVLRIAAHVATGLPLAGREILPGRVLFFAGENPDDVKMRWIKLCEEMKIDPETPQVVWREDRLDLQDPEVHRQAAEYGPFALVVIDTSAAYFHGDNENDRAQMGHHARVMRSLVKLPGGPTVVATAHPTKSYDLDNLLPAGGGTFLNEMDGNLVCIGTPGGDVSELHWHGKFRGSDFAPIPFKITRATSERIKDSKGRLVWTVTAAPISEAEQSQSEQSSHKRQDELMAAMSDNPGFSLNELGRAVGWTYQTGEPNKTLVIRTMKALRDEGLVEKKRGRYVLTKAGEKAAPRGQKGPSRRDEVPLPDGELPF